MNKKILIWIIVFLLLLVGAGAFHMMNRDKIMEWNPMHNMMMNKWAMKMDMWNEEDDAMKEHCKMMPNMAWCEKYKSAHSVSPKGREVEQKWEFDISVEWLPEAKPSEVVKLKDGDSYEMTAYAVKQEVGNRVVKRLSYNWMIPGPLLQVEKWAKIKIKLTNKLWIETTLHSHGLRLDDSKFDGLPTDMWGEQKPMKDWESFTYELDFPDTGVFWYHPHIREDYTQEMGLYGNFNVTEENYWNKVDRDEFLILDDFSLDDPFYKGKINKTLMGRFGNIMMINNEENYKLEVNQYDTVRLNLTNVANTRTFDFGIYKNWKKVDLKLVGWDIWKIEKEVMINSQIIAPAERYIVEVRFDQSWEYVIKSRDRKLGKIIVKDTWIRKKQKEFWSDLKESPEEYSFIRKNFQKFLDQKVDKKLRLTIWMKWMWEMRRWMPMWNDGDEIEWEDNMAMMNKMSNSNMMEWKLVDEETKKENMDIDWKFKKGQFVKVEIYNDPNSMHPMQHPIHFHGQRFLVLSRDWKVEKNLQWKDVSLVKNWERVEILIEMTNPWIWMSHCHIAEHLQSGMMMTFIVEE